MSTEISIELEPLLRKPHYKLWQRCAYHNEDDSYEDGLVVHTDVIGNIGRALRARLGAGGNILDYFVEITWHERAKFELPAGLWMHLVARESWEYVERYARQGLVKDE